MGNMAPIKTWNGYLRVGLNKRLYLVHRLVATAFIPTDNYKLQVNHKDENKLNNALDNLEWCTASYNQAYSKGTHRVLNHESGAVLEFNNIRAFCREYSFPRNALYRLINKEINNYKRWTLA